MSSTTQAGGRPTPSIIVARPGRAVRLVLLMHGVGSVPESMVDSGRRLAAADPEAMVVAVASPQPADISAGRQWFSVRGVTEENRQARVDAAMPGFVSIVGLWQQEAGVGPAQTLIVGFSQGGIMALESTRLTQPPALRVASLAGRYATLPEHKPAVAAIHLLHGAADTVMAPQLAEAAAQRLRSLGATATLDILPGVGHEPHPLLLARLIEHLSEHLGERPAGRG